MKINVEDVAIIQLYECLNDVLKHHDQLMKYPTEDPRHYEGYLAFLNSKGWAEDRLKANIDSYVKAKEQELRVEQYFEARRVGLIPKEEEPSKPEAAQNLPPEVGQTIRFSEPVWSKDNLSSPKGYRTITGEVLYRKQGKDGSRFVGLRIKECKGLEAHKEGAVVNKSEKKLVERTFKVLDAEEGAAPVEPRSAPQRHSLKP